MMSNSKKVLEAAQSVFDDWSKLSEEEFKAKLDKHKDSAFAKELAELWAFGALLIENENDGN